MQSDARQPASSLGDPLGGPAVGEKEEVWTQPLGQPIHGQFMVWVAEDEDAGLLGWNEGFHGRAVSTILLTSSRRVACGPTCMVADDSRSRHRHGTAAVPMLYVLA